MRWAESRSVARSADRCGGGARWYGGEAPNPVETHTSVQIRLAVGDVDCALDVCWTDEKVGDLVRLDAVASAGSIVLEGLFGFSPERRVPHQRVTRFGPDGRPVRQDEFEPGPTLQRAGFEAVLDLFAEDVRWGRRTDWRPIRFAAALGDCLEAPTA